MVMGIRQFEKLFRETASLDIDKSDIKRLEDFITNELHKLLLMGQRSARMHGNPLITKADIPLTKGLQENIHAFKKLDEELSVESILKHLAKHPPMSIEPDAEVEAMLAELAGGITVSLAKVFKVLDPRLKNPQTEHWERVQDIYDILL